MKRIHLNFAIDSLAFVAMLLLCSTGLVLAHQLPPGSGSPQGRGIGHGAAEKTVTFLWGLSRHEWGDIHYWIAYVLLCLVALHVVLHWKWIVCVARGKPTDASPYRLLVGVTGLVFLVLLTATPLLSSTTSVKRGELDRGATGYQADQPGSSATDDESHERIPTLRGSMTFQEISDALHISVTEMLRKAGLPENTSPSERAGRVLRRYGKEMTQFRTALGQPVEEDEHATPSDESRE